MIPFFEEGAASRVYCDVRDGINDWCRDARDFTESIWPRCEAYLDPEVRNDARQSFHQRWWEIYLSHVLLDSGVALVPRQSKPFARKGPDLLALVKNRRFWIEAVTASAGVGPDAVSESEPMLVRDVPHEGIKLRLQSAISEKLRKYSTYRTKGLLGEGEGYIVAINAAQVPSAVLERSVPRIVSVLFPIGIEVVQLDVQTGQFTDMSYQYQECVVKRSGTTVPTTTFLDESSSGISAVLYSCSDAWNRPASPGVDFVLVHNPRSLVPLPHGLLRRGLEYSAEIQGQEAFTVKRVIWGEAGQARVAATQADV
jgi:hypothetical protein